MGKGLQGMTLAKVGGTISYLLFVAYTSLTNEFSWVFWVLMSAIAFELVYAIAYSQETVLSQRLQKIAGAVVIPAGMSVFTQYTIHAHVVQSRTVHELLITTTGLATLAVLKTAIPEFMGLFLKLAHKMKLTALETDALKTTIDVEIKTLETGIEDIIKGQQPTPIPTNEGLTK